MSADLSRLLRPTSIAVIGGGWGVAVVEQALKAGFPGEIWPVHPSRDEMHGLPCFRSLADLPGAPDASFIGVNRHLTIDAVSTLSAMGAGGAVCFASGFAEAEDDKAEGANLQARLIEAAGDMPILGPNCYGLINYLDGALLWPDQHGGARVDRGVAILGQSSNMLINMTMQQRALPVAYVMAAGNQASVGLADMAMAVMEDDRVTAIGLHIEGVGDIRAFEAMAARARDLQKPIVALKVGRSDQARAAAISHTASLAGGDAASRAFLRRLNIAQADTLPAFLEALKLLHVHGALPGRAVSSMSCSGGEASLIADAALGRDVEFRPLTGEDHDRIKATLSDLVTVANPLDYHTFIWNDPPRMTATYVAMMRSGFDLNCLVYDFPRTDRTDDAAWQCGEDAILAARAQTAARIAVVSSLPENMPENRAARLLDAGIAPMMGLEECLSAAAVAADVAQGWKAPVAPPVTLPPDRAMDGATVLDEAASKAALAHHGLEVPSSLVAGDAGLAAEMAAKVGFPVALKGLGIAHKTEADAVRLGLTTAEQVHAAATSMPAAQGFLIEGMVEGAVAELIVGVVRDPVYGFALTIGSGGVLTELLDDSATLLVPASDAEIRSALSQLKVFRILTGYRGKPGADPDALMSAIMAVQAFVAAEAHRLEELDVNPLIVTPTRAVAVDALIRFRA